MTVDCYLEKNDTVSTYYVIGANWPFHVTIGKLEIRLTEEQMISLTDKSNNVLIDYNQARKEKNV